MRNSRTKRTDCAATRRAAPCRAGLGGNAASQTGVGRVCDGRPGLSLRHWMLDVPLERIALTAVSTGMLLERRAREVCTCVRARSCVCRSSSIRRNATRCATVRVAALHANHTEELTVASPYLSTVGVWAALHRRCMGRTAQCRTGVWAATALPAATHARRCRRVGAAAAARWLSDFRPLSLSRPPGDALLSLCARVRVRVRVYCVWYHAPFAASLIPALSR